MNVTVELEPARRNILSEVYVGHRTYKGLLKINFICPGPTIMSNSCPLFECAGFTFGTSAVRDLKAQLDVHHSLFS